MILPLLLAAAAYQDTVALDRAVAAFTSHPVGEAGGARATVDARLRLAACPTVALSWRTEAHDAVTIACAGPDWRLYVPVVRTAGAAIVASSAAAPSPVAGPPVIKRGDPVLVEAGADGFSITREGVAQGDAAAGARFLVRVADAKAPVQAVATADGRAVLPGWNQ
jgi:flagella basal body P-ring formation protein FlgA